MTASIAHELNQPLSGIMSNASAGQRFIDRGDADISMLREILVDIATDGRRAHDVIRNVRNTMKKGATLREPVDLNFVVMKVAHMLQRDITANSCQLETSLAKDLPMVEADPVQIHQVLINLVTNALDAMRDVPARCRKVQVATERNGDGSIRVSVRDYGTGIPEGVGERLFDQFFTTKEEGLGMGLTIVRSLIEAHAGAIGAENVDGGGARFYFTLPVTERLRNDFA
jgi:two-component system sensor kinase FixL